MPTQCNQASLSFSRVEGRAVVAGFDGGTLTSDAGALLLGATDRAIGLMERFAACFEDGRDAARVEHQVRTMVGQRVFAIALGYEDVVDHDELRHDPVLAVLAGKLEARRARCAPLAGKSTLNRLEHAPEGSLTRYHKIGHDPAAIAGLFVDLFVEAHKTPPREIVLDLDATDDPLHGHQEGRFFHGYYDCYCYLPPYVFCGRHLLAAKLRRANIDASAGAAEEAAQARSAAGGNQEIVLADRQALHRIVAPHSEAGPPAAEPPVQLRVLVETGQAGRADPPRPLGVSVDGAPERDTTRTKSRMSSAYRRSCR